MKIHNYGNSYSCTAFLYDEECGCRHYVRAFRSIRAALRFLRKHYPNRKYFVSSHYCGIPTVANFNRKVRR